MLASGQDASPPEGSLQPAALPEPNPPAQSLDPEAAAWRNELAARLGRYRARGKIRPPRYPSLRLPFDVAQFDVAKYDVAESSVQGVRTGTSPFPSFAPTSNHALALDGMNQQPSAVAETEVAHTDPETRPASAALPQPAAHPVASAGAKIIEFPRFAWAPPPPPPDQLAEPVGERPRILEVPETTPPAPALGGITIGPAERKEAERRPGIDLPLQSASLARRLCATAIDGLIIGLATALFGAIFWKVTAIRPPRIQLLGLAAGIPCVLWAAYQYLLIVYASRTPGLRLAGLELTRFDGSRTTRSLRRWRVLASYLSAASLGMGYAWVFLDEDLLCWHDRITRTYLAPLK